MKHHLKYIITETANKVKLAIFHLSNRIINPLPIYGLRFIFVLHILRTTQVPKCYCIKHTEHKWEAVFLHFMYKCIHKIPHFVVLPSFIIKKRNQFFASLHRYTHLTLLNFFTETVKNPISQSVRCYITHTSSFYSQRKPNCRAHNSASAYVPLIVSLL